MDVHGVGDELLDQLDASIIATDLEGHVTRWNRGAEELYGWTRAEARGRILCDLIGCGPTADAVAMLRHGPWQGEMRLRGKDRAPITVHLSLSLLHDAGGEPAGVLGMALDLSQRLETERRLRTANDHLRAVTASMAEGLATLSRDGRVTYLNPQAEELLGLRALDVLGRPLHDVVHGAVCTSSDCALGAAIAAGEVVRSDDETFARGDGAAVPVAFTVSPLRCDDGPGGVVLVFSDITARKAEQARLERELDALAWAARIRDALDTGRFVLHAQPIVDVASGKVVQHELLLRMVADDGTLVPPLEFLPTAERHGLITDIDRWVVRRAARLAADGMAVELNLSGASVSEPGFADVVESALRDAGADPRLVVIEVTETALVTDDEAFATFARRVTDLGCQMALDDFGTGYGGFSYLKRLPVHFLKIDREFVRDVASEEGSRHVVRACVDLARGFGQKTVAEGVEDPGTLALLHSLGVDCAQGFGIARPCALDDLAAAA